MVRTVDFETWAALAVCAGEAALLLLLLARGARSPLTPPVAIMATVLFTWNLSTFAFRQTGAQGWSNVDLAASPLTAPAALNLVLHFVGGTRRFRAVLFASIASFGLLSLCALAAFFVPAAEDFLRSPGWPAAHLVLVVPVIGFGFWVLYRHLRTSADPLERSRTALLMSASAVVAVSGLTEILPALGFPIPRLGSVGTFVFTALVAGMALRLRLFGNDASLVAVLHLTALTVTALLAYLVAFSLLSAHSAALLVASVLITLISALTAREVWRRMSARRKHVDGMILLGRVSSQMAHDLKNPLAALKGACQFLRQEHAEGRSLDAHAGFLTLMDEQIDRLVRVVDRYQRVGRLDLTPRRVDLNALVQSVIALQEQSASPVRLTARLAPSIPACNADPELLSAALDNLIGNAREAMPAGGVVTVSTEQTEDGIWIGVADTGEGMDARTRERAFDELFTTRANGSGLGLAFVRRVVEAHGGRVTLKSELSRGTEVRLLVPHQREVSDG